MIQTPLPPPWRYTLIPFATYIDFLRAGKKKTKRKKGGLLLKKIFAQVKETKIRTTKYEGTKKVTIQNTHRDDNEENVPQGDPINPSAMELE